MQKRLVILGSTGSIGTSAIRVIEHAAGRFQVTGLAAGRRTASLAAQSQNPQSKPGSYASDADALWQQPTSCRPKCRTLRMDGSCSLRSRQRR